MATDLMDATEDIHTGLMDFGAEEGGEKKEEGGGWLDTLQETYETLKNPMDAKEVRELALENPNKAFNLNDRLETPKADGFGTGLGIFNGLVDSLKTVKGEQELVEGIENGNADKALEGTHDVLIGGSGVLGNMDNQFGALAKSFGFGFSVGDAIAPTMFGKEGDHANSSVKDENGQEHAHTGGKVVDTLLDGGHEISNGDYVDGAEDITRGTFDGVETLVNPSTLLTHADPERLWNLGKDGVSASLRGINPYGGLAEKAGESIGDGIGGWLKGDE